MLVVACCIMVYMQDFLLSSLLIVAKLPQIMTQFYLYPIVNKHDLLCSCEIHVVKYIMVFVNVIVHVFNTYRLCFCFYMN